MTTIRRASYISSSSSNSSPDRSTCGGALNNCLSDNLLSARTRNSISKSRRSSLVDGGLDRPTTSSSRRASLVATAAISLLSKDVTKMSNPCSHTYTFGHHPYKIDASDNDKEDEDDSERVLHQSFKVKMSRSSRKLDSFFGETVPIDVCVSEIRKEGIKAVLESKVPLCYFLHYLLGEYSAENLLFYLEVEQLESKQSLNIPEHLEFAQRIYNRYIADNTDLEVNLEDKVKRNIKIAMQALARSFAPNKNTHRQHNYRDVLAINSVFFEAKTSVYILLEASFTRFLQSNIYNDMVKCCGEFTIHYKERTTCRAIQYLVNYLRKQHSRDQQQHKQQRISNKYLVIIQDAIENFVKVFFGPEYLTNLKQNSPSSLSELA